MKSVMGNRRLPWEGGPFGESARADRGNIAAINRFDVIPKPHQPGKWRLIVDLSHPKGVLMNNSIEPELCLLSYTSVDEAVRTVWELGPQTEMAKFDIKSAYHLVPVHPEDRPLLV